MAGEQLLDAGGKAKPVLSARCTAVKGATAPDHSLWSRCGAGQTPGAAAPVKTPPLAGSCVGATLRATCPPAWVTAPLWPPVAPRRSGAYSTSLTSPMPETPCPSAWPCVGQSRARRTGFALGGREKLCSLLAYGEPRFGHRSLLSFVADKHPHAIVPESETATSS